MTKEEIGDMKFRLIGHCSMADCHTSLYKAVNVPFECLLRTRVPVESFRGSGEGRRRRCSKRYFLDGKWITRKQLNHELENLQLWHRIE